MNHAYLSVDLGYPLGGRAASPEERVARVTEAVASLTEKLNYLLSHLSEENFTEAALASMGQSAREPLETRISDLEARVAALEEPANAEGGVNNAAITS